MGYSSIVSQRFDRLDSALQSLLSIQSPSQDLPLTSEYENLPPITPEYKIEDVVGQSSLVDARRAADLLDTKFFYMVSVPEPAVEVEEMFGSRYKELCLLLEHPPTLRYGGWDIQTGTSVQIVKGQLLRTVLSKRKVLEFHRAGVALFSARSDDDFLCWGSNNGRIHPIALMEVVFNFLAFYKDTIKYMRPQPEFVNFVLGMSNLQVPPANRLVPDGIDSIPFQTGESGLAAPENVFETQKRVYLGEFVPEVVTYELVREIYVWFGYDESKIPYVARDNDLVFIDVSRFKNL